MLSRLCQVSLDEAEGSLLRSFLRATSWSQVKNQTAIYHDIYFCNILHNSDLNCSSTLSSVLISKC